MYIILRRMNLLERTCTYVSQILDSVLLRAKFINCKRYMITYNYLINTARYFAVITTFLFAVNFNYFLDSHETS